MEIYSWQQVFVLSKLKNQCTKCLSCKELEFMYISSQESSHNIELLTNTTWASWNPPFSPARPPCALSLCLVPSHRLFDPCLIILRRYMDS